MSKSSAITEAILEYESQNQILKVRLESETKLKQILRKRVAKAIEAARLQARWPHGKLVEVVEATALDLVVAILEGKQ